MRAAQARAQTGGGWKSALTLALRLMAETGAVLETPHLLLQATAAAQAAELPMEQLC